MVARKRYRCTTVGATSVTLVADEPEAAPDAQPGVWGTGTIVLTQGVTPDAEFWRLFSASGLEYLVTIERVG